MKITNGSQNHTRCFKMAALDEPEPLGRGLCTVTIVFASWKHSVCEKLVPLSFRTWIGETGKIFHHIGANVFQRLNKLAFCWSLSADFCIDMYLDERRVSSIFFCYAFYLPLRSDANMRFVKALIVKQLVGFQYPQQLVLVFVRKLMRTTFSFFDWPDTRVWMFWLVLRGDQFVHSSLKYNLTSRIAMLYSERNFK